ncbi:hypothetical protein INT44_005393 [Umbelopsis vinacea]|uniref:Transcription initiation factor TFIID subunit 8 n=1 Tax=Umbelopsis vinacea TaxID=44442 RepID=A0A8H7UPW6_9FUNG|nr:hypothetical protein INT44_005393 [Umbelopsis vinacea]KAI9287490.1 hypothetical protein BC943DRAFT_318206 [Umbelopsis sp. AD052]
MSEQPSPKLVVTATEETASDTCCKIVSAIAREAGFTSTYQSSLYALSDVLALYIEKLFNLSHAYAELGNRTKPNFNDIARGLEEAGLRLSDFEEYLNGLKDQGIISNISPDELQPLPSGETTVEPAPDFLPSDNEDDDEDRPDEVDDSTSAPYVPPHMPRFPSRHSFKQTPVYVGRPEDQQTVRELTSQQSRLVEDNLKRFNTAMESQVLQKSAVTQPSNSTKPIAPIVSYHTVKQRRRRLTELGVSGLTKVDTPGTLNDADAFVKRRRVSDVSG